MSNKFNFTKASLEKISIPSKGKKESYYDTKTTGLMLMVGGSGVKTYYLYKRIEGKPQRVKIGRYEDLSIEQARKQCDHLRTCLESF